MKNIVLILLLVLGFGVSGAQNRWFCFNDSDTLGYYVRDGNKVSIKNETYLNRSYGGLRFKREPLYSVDIESFVVNEEGKYAKDRNFVYYPDIETRFHSERTYPDLEGEWVIIKADPETFEYLGDGYAIDKDKMFLDGVRIPWDKRKIAQYKGLDAKPFDFYYKNLKDVGLRDFVGAGQCIGGYVRKGNMIYHISGEPEVIRLVSGADPESFAVIRGSGYAMDKNNVYYPLDESAKGESALNRLSESDNMAIKEADKASFKYIGDGFAVDKNNMFYNGKKIDWNNLIALIAIELYSRKH